MNRAYEVEVIVQVTLPPDSDDETAYQVVYDHMLAANLPSGMHWAMLEGCVHDVTDDVDVRDLAVVYQSGGGE